MIFRRKSHPIAGLSKAKFVKKIMFAAAITASSSAFSVAASMHGVEEKVRPAVVDVFVEFKKPEAPEPIDYVVGNPIDENLCCYKDSCIACDWKVIPSVKGILWPVENHESEIRFGAGLVIDERGYILTSSDLIENAVSIKVESSSNKIHLDARIVGTDQESGLAVIKVDADEPLPALEFADNDAVNVGDSVFVLGNPFGIGFSLAKGIISARGQTLNRRPRHFIEIESEVNAASAGGPVFDGEARIVGVEQSHVKVQSRNGEFVSTSRYAAPRIASEVVEKIIEDDWLEQFSINWMDLLEFENSFGVGHYSVIDWANEIIDHSSIGC